MAVVASMCVVVVINGDGGGIFWRAYYCGFVAWSCRPHTTFFLYLCTLEKTMSRDREIERKLGIVVLK